MTVPKAGSIKQRKLSRSKDKDKINKPENEGDAQDSEVENTNQNEEEGGKFGALPKMRSVRIWSRAVMMACAVVVALFAQSNDRVLSSHKDTADHRKQHVDCSESYFNEIKAYPGCMPLKCGRGVMDRLILGREAESLMDLAIRGLALSSGSSGGASILDLHSGALSQGKNFINIYTLNVSGVISHNDFLLYKSVKNKILQGVAHSFGLTPSSLYLTFPTFFSRLTADPPVTPHDEYWHPHVDKETYGSFHYTSLLYLNDYGHDYKGGRFAFVEQDNSTLYVEPKRGRVLMFTSGAENKHYVERVKSGTRYAITVSFTCDKTKAIADPTFQEINTKQTGNTVNST